MISFKSISLKVSQEIKAMRIWKGKSSKTAIESNSKIKFSR